MKPKFEMMENPDRTLRRIKVSSITYTNFHSVLQKLPFQITQLPPMLKESTSLGKMSRTMYHNWNTGDKTQKDRSNDTMKTDEKERTLKDRLVYKNRNIKTESVPVRVPERSLRRDSVSPIFPNTPLLKFRTQTRRTAVPKPKIETAPSLGKMTTDWTVYENWNPLDIAKADRPNEIRKQSEEEKAQKVRFLYQNIPLEAEPVSIRVPERAHTEYSSSYTFPEVHLDTVFDRPTLRMVGKTAANKTMYYNWNPDDKAQRDMSNEQKNQIKKIKGPINKTVYENWNPEIESTPLRFQESSYKDVSSPVIPRNYQSMIPTPQSVVYEPSIFEGNKKQNALPQSIDSGNWGMDFSDNDEDLVRSDNSSFGEHKEGSVSRKTFPSKEESGVRVTRKRSYTVPNNRIIEIGTDRFQRKDRLSESEIEKMQYSVEYIDCAGLCAISVNKHMHLTPVPIPIYNSLRQLKEWIGKCNEKLTLSRSERCPCIVSVQYVLATIYAKKILRSSDNLECEKVELLLQHAIESKNYILFAELVHMYAFNKQRHIRQFLKGNENKFRIATDVMLLILKHRLLKKFQSFQKLKIRLILCHRYKDMKLVFLLVYKGIIETNAKIPSFLLGIDVLLHRYKKQYDETKSVFNSCPAFPLKEKLPTVTEYMARNLFVRHSNLNMITTSSLKFVGHFTGNRDMVQKVCITLFCQYKGYIPYGEEEFPRRLGDYETDVLEGYCFFGNSSLELGGHIRRKGVASGSIGGFVNLSDNRIGLITCAHILFSPEELLYRRFDNVIVEAFDKNSHRYQACGKVLDARFPVCKKMTEGFIPSLIQPEDNVDAALVELDPTINSFGFRPVPVDQLHAAGFDPEYPPVFSGEIISVPVPDIFTKSQIESQYVGGRIPGTSDSVIKFGATTGFTIGDLYFNGTHARFINEDVCFPDTDIGTIMCNQIEIQNLPQGDFFSLGDSGSFVFCINPDKTLTCIGMAIGLSARGSCLVTPIDRVIQSFGLSSGLRPCRSFTNSARGTDPNIQTIQTTLENLYSVVMKMQTQLNALDKKVDNRK